MTERVTPEDRALAASLLRREADRLVARIEHGDSDAVRAAFVEAAQRCADAADRIVIDPRPVSAATCMHCWETIFRSLHDRAWLHTLDGSRICYPNDGDVECVAEPSP